MGWGDEIMVTGQARKMQETHPGIVVVRDRRGMMRSHEMWKNNPRIAGRNQKIASHWQELTNGPGVRPYIHSKSDQRWQWRAWECPRGEIYFDPEEQRFANAHAGLIVIEPNTKAKASPNKDWGRARWVQLVAILRANGLKPYQIGAAGTQVIEGARLLETPSFRHACAVLSKARGAILPEGGLHHAAACFHLPTVVIFGGYISPAQTGYSDQINIYAGGDPCGMRIPCAHCARAMDAIKPIAVAENLMSLLK